MPIQNRTEIAGNRVRFYAERSEAIQMANLMTKSREYQHRAESFGSQRWLIHSVRGEMYDIDGRLPQVVVNELLGKGLDSDV